MTILIGKIPPIPPDDLLYEAIQTGNLDNLEQWFIGQKQLDYSFQTVADFVAEERSKKERDNSKERLTR